MRSQKGITLVALVVYIVVFIIILAIMANITNGFFSTISGIKEPIEGIAEFNKFSMMFINDVKTNKSCTIENANKIVFTAKEHTEVIDGNDFIKNIVNVDMIVGVKKELIKRNIDFVLRYW